MSANPPAPATPPAAVPPAQPPAEGASAPDPKELETLRTHIETMKRDNAKLRDQLRATKASVPPPDAAARAQADAARASAIRVAALGSLVGKPGATVETAEFIAWKAAQDPTITVGDDGSVIGLEDVVARVLGAFPQPAAPAAPPTAPPAAPTPPAPKSFDPPDPRFANVKSVSDLLGIGAMALSDFKEKYPARFAQLEAAAKIVR